MFWWCSNGKASRVAILERRADCKFEGEKKNEQAGKLA